MPYCPNCGCEITSSMSFCPNCGSSLNGTTSTYEESDYSVYLYDKGSATKLETQELLMDLLGYTKANATEITNNLPCEIATNLTLTQATYICQAFAEYGMEITVGQRGNSVNINDYSSNSSIFDDDGALLAAAAAVFASISVANRVTRYERWHRPSNWDYFFRPRYVRPARPKRRRHKIDRGPAPRKSAPKAPKQTPRRNDNHRNAGGPTGGGRGNAGGAKRSTSGGAKGGAGGSKGGAGGGKGGPGGAKGGKR